MKEPFIKFKIIIITKKTSTFIIQSMRKGIGLTLALKRILQVRKAKYFFVAELF